MIRPLLACCLALAALCAGDSMPPHQGTVVLPDRSFENVWILSENLDGLVHTLDDKKDSPPTTLERKRYLRVDYSRPNEVSWLRGDNAVNKGQWAEAGAYFIEATKKTDTWYTRESGYLRAAESFLLAAKWDDTIKAVDGLIAINPKSAQLPRLTYLKGQALQKKGDAPGALKAYAELIKRVEWGIEALALGSLGQAELLTAEGKHAEAAKVLLSPFSKLDPVKQGELLGQVGVALANSQQAASQNEAALATLRRLAYAAADGATRARAQIAWAKLLATSDATLFEAFDHAAIAMNTRDAGPAADQGAQLARQISGRIDKLPEAQASNELKAEYRRYLSR